MIVQTVLFGVAVLLIKCSSAEYDVEKYCELIQPGTKLPSLESCQLYYTCMGAMRPPLMFSCQDNDVFDKNAQNCIPAYESNCLFDDSNPCENKTNEFAYSNRGCKWYNYCIDGEIAGTYTCDSGEIFYAEAGVCINGKCDDSRKGVVTNVCEVMPNGVYFGDFDECRNWHLCSPSGLQNGACRGSLVFDVKSGSCLENKDNMCQRASNVVNGVASGPPQGACTTPNQKVADTNVCSIYYTCQKNSETSGATNEWKQGNCRNQYFDVISQQCTDVHLARVHPDCNRCQLFSYHTPTYWVNKVDPSCQKYSTCEHGQRIGENAGECEEDHYYDETSQYCIARDGRLDQYEQHAGACQNYTCNELRECSLSK